MYRNINLSFIVMYNALSSMIECSSAKLIAVSNSPYTLFFYEELHTEDAPLELDPVKVDAQARDQICEDITSSGFFPWWHLFRVDKAELSPNLHHPKYSDVFRQYANHYQPQDFLLRPSREFFRDYLFVCPLKRRIDREIVPFYVSKEYNVSPFGDLYMPGRFVFGNFAPAPPNIYTSVMLAEEPARAYMEANFDVELHYLRVRKYVHPVESNDIDPLCKLISGPTNQHYRLCVVISTSSYFKDEIIYPRQGISPCQPREISFQTEAGKKEAAGNPYYERMTPCYSAYLPPREGRSVLYISRGYMSNQVLVYRLNPSDDKIYLENLSTNIGVVDELNSFMFVED